jgi:hypothetical protein
MQQSKVEHWIVRLNASIDLVSGTRRLEFDDLVASGLESATKGPSGSIVELHMEIVVSGLILDIPNPAYPPSSSAENGSAPDENTPITIRAPWVEERFARAKPRLERMFEENARAIACRHLGERGWMIMRTEVELGSLTWRVVWGFPAALWFAYQAVGGYPDFKDGVREVFEDVVEIAPEMSRAVAATSLGLEHEPLRPRPREEPAKVAPDAPRAAHTDQMAALPAAVEGLNRVSTSLAETADRLSRLEARLNAEGDTSRPSVGSGERRAKR